MESRYSIKDLERLTGVKAHTIRIWEQRYEIVQPQRTETNIRYYRDKDLKRLLNVAVLVHNGIKISKVACLSDAERNSLVLDSSKYNGNYESQINGLKIAMLDYNEELFERILTHSMSTIGSEETFSKIVGEFIFQVGLLWQTNTISISHEHFASNLIRQKLCVAIDSIITSNASDARKTYVLYLPADELHEIGLLYMAYILRNAGQRVIYLGQSVPLDYLKDVMSKVEVDAFVSILTTQPCYEDLDEYFELASEMVKGSHIEWHFAGRQLEDYQNSVKVDQFTFSTNVVNLRQTLLSRVLA